MERDAKIKIREIRVDGGMINNNNFLQSLSNITQVKILKPENIETTSLGVAYLAGLNAGLIKNVNAISKFWKKRKIAKQNTSKYTKVVSQSQQRETSLLKKAENEDLKHTKITNELRTKIIQGRASQKWKQKDVTQKCNLPISVINNI